MNTPFITGSRVYGTPTSKSDIDLVLPPMDPRLRQLLIENSDNSELPIKYGKLNLIICTLPEQYELWKQGTKELIAKSPVTRQEAIDHFDNLFTLHNLPRSCGDSGLTDSDPQKETPISS